ncbi:MAG: hypothetical protein GOMPHAMPRED_004924 [Gomphillus americanus]|uniref:DUF8004 domain-containing protein n=1 Tax=Gomphillus americanus TaxID=1940652 RepID=A0A8H3EHD5_9LECA|nr:MAG: hypothetical protein GOMPHAMPRED_004924 [Gomphillus americanus]
MSRSSSQVRGPLQVSIPDHSIGLRNYGDLDSRLPASPSPHARKPSYDAWSNKSGASREANSRTHSRLPSLQTNQLPPTTPGPLTSNTATSSHSRLSSVQASQLFLDSPGPPTSRTITQSFYQPNSRPMSRGRLDSEDLLPPPPIGANYVDHVPSPTGSRSSSLVRGRPDSVTSSNPTSRANSPAAGSAAKLNKKRTWMRSKSHGREGSISAIREPWAFIVGTPEKTEYNLQWYIAKQPVSELWDEQGDLFVHLFGETEGPSFRLNSNTIESSKAFQRLLGAVPRSRESSVADVNRGMRQMSLGTNKQLSSRDGGQKHLNIALTLSNGSNLDTSDLENLVAVRNLFAFLVGQILVGTPKQPTLYAVFKNIAGLLEHYEFTNNDGSTFGEIPKQNFLGYIEDLRLDDVRNSREKTLEALVLGERMKAWQLYNEGYVHAIGKWNEIYAMDSENMRLITPLSRKRMEKSHMDLHNRLHAAELRLNDFDFPSLFQGIAASSTFQKAIDVKTWRASWTLMKKFTTNYYKNKYGAWPPKASSKKNAFEESGLNRIVLQEMYKDFCDLYDMLVDKTNPTTRSADLAAHDERLAESDQHHFLRHLMSEFDRSSPPVKPPVPYDLCLVPDLKLVVRDYGSLSEKKQAKERTRKLKSDEINLALIQSYDRDSMRATSFLESFMAYERSLYQGKSMEEIVDHRIGQWIFLYVILQSLPLLVVDAPGVRWTEGVEYFLCEVPKGTPPWLREDQVERRAYRGATGQGLAHTKPDAFSNSVEGIYSRSHCWERARLWGHGTAKVPIHGGLPDNPTRGRQYESKRTMSHGTNELNDFIKDLPPPPAAFPGQRISSFNSSPRDSWVTGLEGLPLPPPLRIDASGMPGRKASASDLSKTFDDILGPATATSTTKKKGWGSFSG